jgi:hypothetical protein
MKRTRLERLIDERIAAQRLRPISPAVEKMAEEFAHEVFADEAERRAFHGWLRKLMKEFQQQEKRPGAPQGVGDGGVGPPTSMPIRRLSRWGLRAPRARDVPAQPAAPR